MRIASQLGLIEIDVIPYDIIHPRTPRSLISLLQSLAFVLEHAPLVKELCGTLYISAKKPGDEEARRPSVSLAEHPQLAASVSVVVPCHNEEMNVEKLVDTLLAYYGPYILEIIIVNDNSKDATAAITRQISRREPRVKLVDRTPPNGVGRALRDGYAVAQGRNRSSDTSPTQIDGVAGSLDQRTKCLVLAILPADERRSSSSGV
jgi:hypothetical protein